MNAKRQAVDAFMASDIAWDLALRIAKIDRYTLEARGKPNSPLRKLWVARWYAMRSWEIASGLNYDAHAKAPMVQQ
jgi:hypothetical protein